MAYAEVVVSSSQATSQSLPISVLDLIPTRAGEPASSAIAQSVELARHVEQLGYKRYWVAEHHSIQGLVCSATPVLIGHIAAATKKIRVGSGGVMLPNHAPLVVAEQFGTLESMYPGRIDLGLGRAPGGDFQTMRALRRGLARTNRSMTTSSLLRRTFGAGRSCVSPSTASIKTSEASLVPRTACVYLSCVFLRLS